MNLFTVIFIQILITITAVVGVYILTGLTGMFSLGQAAFMAIGAYTSGILVVRYGFPFPAACILAILITVLIGFIVGLPTVRLRQDYISLVTLGFGEAITSFLNQSVQLTGGASGFSGIPPITTLPLALVSTIIVIAIVVWFKTSKYGRQCIAVRNDPLAAGAVGVNVARIRMIAFLFSVAVSAWAGCLYAFFTCYVDPSGFGWRKSADWVIMVFFGGVNSLTGAIFAALLLTGLPELLRFLAYYRTIIYAALVILIINFKPEGIFGQWELTPLNVAKLFSSKSKTLAQSGKRGDK